MRFRRKSSSNTLITNKNRKSDEPRESQDSQDSEGLPVPHYNDRTDRRMGNFAFGLGIFFLVLCLL